MIAAVLFALLSKGAFSAPIDFKLLPLVPPGAQLVSGFEARQNPYRTGGGSLLLITVNNNLDYQDWLSISGVDPGRGLSEVIYVSMAHPEETPREHLLLVKGAFDRERIFRSAEMNGATLLKYLGEPILLIEPFAREKMEMKSDRWLAILKNQTVIFGTPWMVQQALIRSENRVLADPALMNHLALFNSDVNCWNVMTPMPQTSQSVFLDSTSPWSALLENSDFLLVGAHADSKIRIDLALRTSADAEAANLNVKAVQFGLIFVREPAREVTVRPLKKLQVEGNRLHASVVLSTKDFLAWRSGEIGRSKEVLHRVHEVEKRVGAGAAPVAMSVLPPPAQ